MMLFTNSRNTGDEAGRGGGEGNAVSIGGGLGSSREKKQ